MYYLDNAATTRPLPRVIEIVQKCLSHDFGNPSSLHPPGIKANELVETARRTLASLFRVPAAGIVFCSSGTESDNLALKGILESKSVFRGRLITSQLEHAAVLQASHWLQQHGVEVDFVGINPQTGQIDIADLKKLIVPQTRLVSFQHINSETGVIQDLTTISKVVKEKNNKTLIHSDGVQAFTKIPVDLRKLGVDLYSISAHKFHGIKGAGALILGRDVSLQCQIHGGGQEFGLRSGTENVAAIAAMGLAAQISNQEMGGNYQKVQTFSTWFKRNLKKQFPEIKLFEPSDVVPHIISMSFPDLPGEVLLHHLAEKNIFVSRGSACNTRNSKLSAVLQALKFSQKRIRNTIRISLSAHDIPENPLEFLDIFIRVVEKLVLSV